MTEVQNRSCLRQYLREVEGQNPLGEPVHEQDQVSTTDPDSTYTTKGGKSNRAASPTPPEIEIRSGAVLPGCRRAEPQALGAVPQPTDKTRSWKLPLKRAIKRRKTQRAMPHEKWFLLR